MKTIAATIIAVILVMIPSQAFASYHHILVTGDSISAGVGTANPARESFSDHAANILNKRVQVVAHPGGCLVAQGCGYPVTLVSSFQREVLSQHPGIVIVEIGVNDLNHATTAQMISAYKYLRWLGYKAHTKVVLSTITPQGNGLMWPVSWTASQRAQVNNWIRTQPHVEFARALGGSKMRNKYNSGDGLHPNNLGAKVLGKTLANYIRSK